MQGMQTEALFLFLKAYAFLCLTMIDNVARQVRGTNTSKVLRESAYPSQMSAFD